MNKTQKGACYGILLSLLLAGIVIFDLIDTIVGWPTKVLVGAVWGGLLLVPVYFLERKKGPRGVDMDERDKLIEKNANLAGFGAVYLYVIVMSFLPIGILGEEASIPVTWCPVLLIGAGFC